MEILDVMWFTNSTAANGCIGIVKVLDKWDGIKYYIGLGRGADAESDAQLIAGWGSSFPTESGDKLFFTK